jgi:hypothetical protein
MRGEMTVKKVAVMRNDRCEEIRSKRLTGLGLMACTSINCFMWKASVDCS